MVKQPTLTKGFRDFPEMLPWLPAGSPLAAQYEQGSSSTSILVPCFTAQIGLSNIIENMLSGLFSPGHSPDTIARQILIESLNLDLYRWELNLPTWAQWNRWESNGSQLLPNVAALR